MPLVYNPQTQQYNYIVMSCAHCGDVAVAPTVIVVKDIAARNALTSKNGLVKVLDASADQSVGHGYAYYVFIKGLGWDKVSEEESMDLDLQTAHIHPDLTLLNSYTHSNNDIGLATDLAYLLNDNKTTLPWLTEDADHHLLFRGERVGMGDDEEPIVTTFLDFTFDQTSSIMRWSLDALKLDRGLNIDIWRVVDGNDHMIIPDVYYDNDYLYVDLTGFPGGAYKLSYPKKLKATIGYSGFALQFQITEGQTIKLFTLTDLRTSKRVVPTVWRVGDDGTEYRTKMDMYYSASDTLVLNTTGFTPGTYNIRYFRNYPVNASSGTGEVTTAQLNAAIATRAPANHIHDDLYAPLSSVHTHGNKEILDAITEAPATVLALTNLTTRVSSLETAVAGLDEQLTQISNTIGN